MNVPHARIILILLAVTLAGCVITSREETEYEGKHVGETTLSQIGPGSPEDFVLALLGEPTERIKFENGTTLLKWSYAKTTTRRGTIIVLFAGKSTTRETGTIYVTLIDGMVNKVWRD